MVVRTHGPWILRPPDEQFDTIIVHFYWRPRKSWVKPTQPIVSVVDIHQVKISLPKPITVDRKLVPCGLTVNLQKPFCKVAIT